MLLDVWTVEYLIGVDIDDKWEDGQLRVGDIDERLAAILLAGEQILFDEGVAVCQ